MILHFFQNLLFYRNRGTHSRIPFTQFDVRCHQQQEQIFEAYKIACDTRQLRDHFQWQTPVQIGRAMNSQSVRCISQLKCLLSIDPMYLIQCLFVVLACVCVCVHAKQSPFNEWQKYTQTHTGAIERFQVLCNKHNNKYARKSLPNPPSHSQNINNKKYEGKRKKIWKMSFAFEFLSDSAPIHTEC